MAGEASRLAAIGAARSRRAGAGAARNARIEWFIEEVLNKTQLTLKQRMTIAVDHVRNKVVQNISRPVTKQMRDGKTIVTNRSKPGEFPKADTTQLLKTIFGQVIDEGNGILDGVIGTPIDYGLILETKMKRSFLLRTLTAELPTITRIMSGPIKG